MKFVYVVLLMVLLMRVTSNKTMSKTIRERCRNLIEIMLLISLIVILKESISNWYIRAIISWLIVSLVDVGFIFIARKLNEKKGV